MNDRIRFGFNFDKFRDVLTFLAARVKDLDKLKAVKLIYLADRLHLLKYGRPITGDTYFRLQYGPVPSLSKDFIDDLICPVLTKVPMPELNDLKKRVRVTAGRGKHPKLEAKGGCALNSLSASEEEVLQKVVTEFGKYSGGKLIDITHKHATSTETALNQEIDYRLFFKGATEVQEGAFEYMLESQEDAEFVSVLNG